MGLWTWPTQWFSTSHGCVSNRAEPVMVKFVNCCGMFFRQGLLLATRAHYRSKAEILQECIQRFSKTFLVCFFYCKFRKEEIDCTTIFTAAQIQSTFKAFS